MSAKDIIAKLKECNLLGRSGSAFPTGLKWEMVKNAKSDKKYIICNGSEGDPKVFKDKFILEKYPKEVIEGIKIALKTIDNSSAYIYLQKDYYNSFRNILEKLIQGSPITLFKKPGGYLAGEETVICEVIEGKSSEPRIKPPFPTQVGLWNRPTLINNVETFYQIAKIAKEDYKKTRFYSLSGKIKKEGVYELSEDWTIKKILKETKNWPDFEFFLQVGGGAIGEILLPQEVNQKVGGSGAIIVFDARETRPLSLMKQLAEFFNAENCDRCVPCREGIYRIVKMVEKGKIDKKLLNELFFVLEETSFCGLGKGSATLFRSLVNKLL